MANAEKILGRPLNERERAYLEDVIEQGNRTEEFLRSLGYFDKGPRGKLLRTRGITVKTDSEAEEILKSLEGKAGGPHPTHFKLKACNLHARDIYPG